MKHILFGLLIGLFAFSCSEQKAPPIQKEEINDSWINFKLSKHKDYEYYIHDFAAYTCECVDLHENSGNLELLVHRYNECTKKFLLTHVDKTRVLHEYLKSNLKGTHSDYDIGKMIGTQASLEATKLLIKNCANYRLELIKAKPLVISSIGATKENANSLLKKLEGKLKSSKTTEDRINLYGIIGVLQEYMGKPNLAKKSYNQGLKLDTKSTNICFSFLEVLQDE